MLPELLFSSGITMQNISREELSLLSSRCEKEAILVSAEPSLDRFKLEQTPELEPLAAAIKSEEATDAFQWHTNTNIESNLLRHSDDPLISGAVGDSHNEFDTMTNSCSDTVSTNGSSLNRSQSYNLQKPTKPRKTGNQMKLHFHYQDLPREYLEHYEATQNQTPNNNVSLNINNGRALRKDRALTAPPKMNAITRNDTKEHEISTVLEKNVQKPNVRIPSQELPYMGEITLDNFKPRRGRKPKKADICHLIYKNYGTVVAAQKSNDDAVITTKVNETIKTPNAQHRIISSLLEKRLTGNKQKAGKNHKGDVVQSDKQCERNTEEPLNLCVRDRDDVDGYEGIDGLADKLTTIKSELESSILDSNANVTQNLKMALPDFQRAMLDVTLQKIPKLSSDALVLNSFEQWSNAGLLINPMALYLQKIVNPNRQLNAQQLTNVQAIKSSSIENGTADIVEKQRTLVPRKISQLLKENTLKTQVKTSQNNGITRPASMNTSASMKSNGTAPKRKRSAIFIPPIPEESSTNHATEVSICKFKFTGGAKPSLQEKKMLSVDAGGNFRYYSGTGDKSIRGYEFFPRESLQQSNLGSSSNAGAFFLNTPGQKLSNDLPPPSFGLTNELLKIPELSGQNSVEFLSKTSRALASPPSPSSSSPTVNTNTMQQNGDKILYHNVRKRKSKRSIQREKLEKTFKEKGFLIQTQQLEQAEGTYCKFRQLRKFTRYLFRSWKDYLPGELQQNQNQNQLPSTSTSAEINQSLPNDQSTIDTSEYIASSPASSHDD